MDKLSAYSAYQGSSANYVRNGKETSRSSAQGTSRTNRTQQDKTADKVGQNELNLSDEAKDLLQELKEKYRNMDFMVAHFSSDEEAQSYLSRGTKDYSVLIDPETLEAMAADEETKEKYINMIDEATTKLDDVKVELSEEAEESGSEIKSIGITLGDDGTVSYFAELEKAGAKQKERIESSREKKAEEKKADEKKAAQEKAKERLKAGYGESLTNTEKKTTMVSASSIEELLEKIRSVDWNAVKAEIPETGSRFNCTI